MALVIPNQGRVRNSPFSHIIEVWSPPCRVVRDGKMPLDSTEATSIESVHAVAASRLEFGTVGG